MRWIKQFQNGHPKVSRSAMVKRLFHMEQGTPGISSCRSSVRYCQGDCFCSMCHKMESIEYTATAKLIGLTEDQQGDVCGRLGVTGFTLMR